MTVLLEIDLDAIADNWRLLDGSHPGATAGVIKADAYGTGAALVAPKLFAAGCRHFFVAHLDEALAIRPLVPGALLGVLNGIRAGEVEAFSAHGITAVLGSVGELGLWRAEAARLGRALPAMLHLDTGMSRLGFTAAEMAALDVSGLELQYIMTHLVSADDPGDPRSAAQAAAFAAVAAHFPGVKRSLANSYGMFLSAGFHSDLARPGAALYGINPTPGRPNPMRNTVRLTAPILQIRELSSGQTVGYNATWTAARPSRIAVLGVGYADGYHRSLSNLATARFDGAPVPLVGRVSMDLTTFDVTGTSAKPGDHLELLGPGHGADALAAQAGTNGYEILTSLGRRYQRQYIGA